MDYDEIKNRMYLKVPYSILDCGWVSNPKTFLTFMHLMLLANRKPHNYMGGVIDRGEVLASYEFLAKHTGLSVQNVRTAISNLKKTNMIKHRIINGTNVFTIVKYMDYQSLGADSNNLSTNDQQTENVVAEPFPRGENLQSNQRLTKEQQMSNK